MGWSWNFGDGNTSTEQNPTYTYATNGTYDVTLTVIDADGFESSITKTITVEQRIIYVDDDFVDDPSHHKWDTLTDGMDDALDGDLIYVYNGTYNYVGGHALEIDKAVEIVGENRDSVLLTGTGNHPIAVFSDGASLKNVTFSRASGPGSPTYAIEIHSSNVIIEYCNFTDLDDGILLASDSLNAIIRYNNFWNLNGKAIELSNTDDHYIYNNSLWDCDYGIWIQNSYNNFVYNNTLQDGDQHGIYLYSNAHNNFIYTNTVENFTQGIYLYSSVDSNNINNNTVIDCNYGIRFYGATSNIITYNNISDNSQYGIKFDDGSASAYNTITYNDINDNGQYGIYIPYKKHKENDDNTFHHNNLIGNSLGNAYDECNNDWDDGVSEGNYWNDYVGSGSYAIPGGENQDNYPLASPV